MNKGSVPFFVLHYAPAKARRAYIEREWNDRSERAAFDLQFVTQHDQEELHVRSSYIYDENSYREMIRPIKSLQIGYWLGLCVHRTLPFNSCVEWHRSQNTTLEEDFKKYPWLNEGPLSPGDVSLIWKHREGWAKIAQSHFEYAIVAEDDIIFSPHSLKYLVHLLQIIPADAEYVDIAGGVGFKPRVGNNCVHNHFFEIHPPKTRTTCAAILSRSFAQRLVQLSPPICLGIDWMLNWAFMKLNTTVYWVEPTVFGHGSQMNVYASFREAEHPSS